MVGLIAPTQTVLALDFYPYDSSGSMFGVFAWNPPTNTTTLWYHRHLDGLNFLFCDGHVKWLKPETVKERTSDPRGTGNSGSPLSTAYTFCTN
jgi:prepilin-type processing-associated H-X9-DG protein